MEVLGRIYGRFVRPFALSGGLAVYVALTWGLQQSGYFRATQAVYLQIVAMWLIGFAALAALPKSRLQPEHSMLVLMRTIWCNMGVVAMAVLVPNAMRIIILVPPLFGLMYAALYLKRSHVAFIALFTWLFYVLSSLGLASYEDLGPQLELFLGIGFGFILLVGLVLIFEGQVIRDGLRTRNNALRQTMSRLQEMALRDELTGLHNRRHILDVLLRQKSLAEREQQDFTICYCDLDHFKLINDRYGHVTGDLVLRQFADLAAGLVRDIDYVARFGGEEFILVLIGANEQAAENVANRLRARTRQMSMPGTPSDFVLTVSVGVTSFKPGERVDETLNRADRALYSAKMSGRDKVVLVKA